MLDLPFLIHTSKDPLILPMDHLPQSQWILYTHTLLCLLCISNQSRFHQCPTQRMFSSEDGPNTEMVSNASTITILEVSALIYCI
jgi:hypothetical protein